MKINFPNLGTVNKSLSLLVIVAALPAIAIMVYSGLELRQRLVDNARNDAMHVTETMAEIHKEIAHNTKQLLSTIALLPAIQNGDIQAVNYILKSVFDQNPTYLNFTLTNLSGDVIAAAVPFSSVNLGDRKHFREAVTNKSFAVGEYILARTVANSPALPFAFPVLDKAGNPAYILTTAIRLNVYQRFYDGLHLPEKSFIAVTDHQGIRLLYYPPNEKNPLGKPIKARSREMVQNSQQGKEVFLGSGSDGIDRILTFEKFHPADTSESFVYLWAGIPVKEVLAPANAIFFRNILIILFATLMALTFAIAIGRKTIILPIRNLMLTTKEFATGNLNFRSQPVEQPDEFRQLTEAFDKMAFELDKHRKHLNELVEERTSQLHNAQEQLIQKERLAVLGQLATTVSHELRNPLGTVVNIIDILEDEIKRKDFDNIQAKLNIAARNIDRCDRIINELLEFANGKEPQVETVDFDNWLQELLKDIYWPSNITRELKSTVGTVLTIDPSLMDRIVSNLVNNAIHALDDVDNQEKSIQIATAINNGNLIFSVKDNGPGMSPKTLNRIFEPLYSTKTFGVGLGMSIVKNAVESLNGTINIESDEGVGTSVRVTIPIEI